MQSTLATRLGSLPLVYQVLTTLKEFAIGRYVLVWATLMWENWVPPSIDQFGCRSIDMIESLVLHAWETMMLVRSIILLITQELMYKMRMRYEEIQATYCHQLIRASTMILHTRVMQHLIVPVIGIIADSTLPVLDNIANALREQLVYYLVLSKVTLQGHLGFVGICAP